MLDKTAGKRTGKRKKPAGSKRPRGRSANRSAKPSPGGAIGRGAVRCEIERGVATLMLDRPEARNALTPEMFEALDRSLDRIESDPSVRLVILRGDGDHLSAGADVKVMLEAVESGTPEGADRFLAREYAVDMRLAGLSVPVVTIADGITMGGGLGLAFGGYIIATTRSRFAMPETRIGFLTDIGATHELVNRLGLPLARYFAWTAESFNGEQAMRWGFADALIEPGEVDSVIAGLARAARGGKESRARDGRSGKEPAGAKKPAGIARIEELIAAGTPASRGREGREDREGRRGKGVDNPTGGSDPLRRMAEKHFTYPSRHEILKSLEVASASAAEDEERDWASFTLEVLKHRSPVSIWASDLLLSLDYEKMTGEFAGRPEWRAYLEKALGEMSVDAPHLAKLENPTPRQLALAVEYLVGTTLFRHPDFAEGVGAFRDKRPPDFPSAHEPLGVHRSLFHEKAGWMLMQHAARLARDPFWLDIARRELDWIRPPSTGYDDATSPRVQWFADGTLNASVEAVDRWVKHGFGGRTAFIWEGDRIDSDRRPLEQRSISYGELQKQVRHCAAALRALGLRRGDSLVLYMPNIIETYVVQLAAARIGVVYHPVFAGFAREELSDRLHMMGARILITVDGAFRKGEVIQYKRDFVDPALADFVPVESALEAAKKVLEEHDADRDGHALGEAKQALADKVTVEKKKIRAILARGLAEGAAAAKGRRAGVAAGTAEGGPEAVLTGSDRPFMERIAAAGRLLDEEERARAAEAGGTEEAGDDKGAGRLTPEEEALDEKDKEIIRAYTARLEGIRRPVEKVVVLQTLGTRGEGRWIEGRDLPFDRFIETAGSGPEPANSDPEEMNAEDALFVMFTSGSTGKPKGLVHTHGGYLTRLPFLLRTLFGLTPDQRILTVADPGWITGQSYVCWGPLCYGMTSILVGFVPSEDRLWAAIERYRANFLKTGVTGIRASMGDDPEHIRSHDLSSLRHRGGESTLAAIQRAIETTGRASTDGAQSGEKMSETQVCDLARLSLCTSAAYLSRWTGRPSDWPALFEEALVVARVGPASDGAGQESTAGAEFSLDDRTIAGLRETVRAIAKDAGVDASRYTSCSCAEPLDAAVQAWWETHIGPMMNCYWRTEDSAPETGASPIAHPQKPDSSARPLSWAEPAVFVIRDEDGNRIDSRPAEIGEKGTVFVRNNPGIARGTWARPVRDDDGAGAVWQKDPRYAEIYHTDVPGWHNTGDAGVTNPDGTLTFLGRDDEVLNVSGHRVGTQEIEGAVRSHPAVGNVAAIGIPAEVKGDNPVLFVKLREGHTATGLLDNQLREAVTESKGAHIAPSADFIFYVTNLPTTKSGKILRRFLKYAAALDRNTLSRILGRLRDERLRAGLIAADREALQTLFPPLVRQGRTIRLGSVATVDQMSVVIDVLQAVARRREITIEGDGTDPGTARGHRTRGADEELAYRPYLAAQDATYALGRTDFRPGVDLLPPAQEAWAMTRDAYGRPVHGEPEESLVRIVEPAPDHPEPNEVIVQNLFAGSTHNVLHALLADPMSPFEWHRQPYHTLGSGAVCRVVRCGREVDRQGLFEPGQLAVNFPALYRVLDPRVSEDAMHAGFEIQGFETPNGTLRPFDRLQATQLLPVPKGLTMEQAASFMLNLVTVYRALTHRMPIRRGQSLLVEGATGGTGTHAVEIGRILGARVIGMVSNPDRGQHVLAMGAAAFLNRKDAAVSELWTPVPDEPEEWDSWERAGRTILDALRNRNGGHLVDAVVSFTGRPAFGRLVQMLAPGGRLTFFGAFLGYCQRFLGKGPEQGASDILPAEMFARAGLRPGMGVVVHYGAGAGGGVEDRNGIEAIRAAAELGARVVALTGTDAQSAHLNRDQELSSRLVGTVSLEALQRGSRFEWPDRMPDYDRDPKRYERYENLTLKPLASAIGRLLRTAGQMRGQPDVIYARGDEDTLAADLFMVKPFTGTVVYGESRRRAYTMYAPQVWMRQRRTLFPSFSIIGSHMGNPQQGREVIDWIAQGILRLKPPRVYEADQAPLAFQEMHTNAASGTFVVHLTAPGRGLTTAREIDEANGANFIDNRYVTVRLDAIDRSAPEGNATHIARVTLRSEGGRPPSLARDAIYQIGDAFRRLRGDSRIAAVILTGEGSVAFLAGQDLRQLYDDVDNTEAAVTIARDAQKIFDEVESFPRPVISVVNGVALGGGHELMMSTHYRLAVRSPRVRLGQPEIVLGIIPGFAGTQRLTRLLVDRMGLERGVREALEMILTGRHYEVDEALSLGLLEEVVENGALERAYRLAVGHALATGEGKTDILGEALAARRRAREAWRSPQPLPERFLDDDARLKLVLEQAIHPGIGRGAPAIRAIEATLLGLEKGFEAGCEREAWLFASLVVDERFGRRGIRRFLERQEPAPLPSRRTEDLSEGRKK